MKKKKKALPSFPYLVFIVFFPSSVSFSIKKCLEFWITNWLNINTWQSEAFFSAIKEKNISEKILEFEELFMLDEMLKEYRGTNVQESGIEIHKEIIQLLKTYNEYRLHIIVNILTNIICYSILGSCLFAGKEKLGMLNSRVKELFYNLNDTTKALYFILVTDLFVGYHSSEAWELIIVSVSKGFGLTLNENFIHCFRCLIPSLLDIILKYWVYYYLIRLSPSLVVVYKALAHII
uniref:envelope membrane protein n=1 Tax=Xyris capensis TaxID=114207 RepID=UPI001F146382|nr:envelope membrane protein [Xyris capensis]ULQ68476.1 envelope membrane protein [Xyris capensis]ULQ68568.1 envelope membrane protein [Xyris capensis]